MTKESFTANVDLKETGFGYTLSLIGGKYKMTVLYALYANNGPIRYNQ
ncbi:transcriptional regulator, partial [Bacillus safensis]|nr:transcriptional regulator [Bacillus safensis]